MIGVTRRIFEVMLVEVFLKYFIYEVLIILMVEVLVIVNVRFLVSVFSDLEVFEIFILLTLLI